MRWYVRTKSRQFYGVGPLPSLASPENKIGDGTGGESVSVGSADRPRGRGAGRNAPDTDVRDFRLPDGFRDWRDYYANTTNAVYLCGTPEKIPIGSICPARCLAARGRLSRETPPKAPGARLNGKTGHMRPTLRAAATASPYRALLTSAQRGMSRGGAENQLHFPCGGKSTLGSRAIDARTAERMS